MVKFDHARERSKRTGKKSPSGRDRSSRRDSDDSPRSRFSRDSGRGNRNNGRGRGGPEMTRVTCSSCGVECEVPFKPKTSKPIYCENCFSKKEKSPSERSSGNNKELEMINKKLDKIMKALDI